MYDGSEAEKLLRKHKVFWGMEKAEHPLVHVIPHVSMEENIPFPYPEGEITGAGMIDPDGSRQFLGHDWGVPWGDELVLGDVFCVGRPDRRVPWMEAIVGCPVRSSSSSGTIWAETYIDDWSQIERIQFCTNNEWLQLLLESIHILVMHSMGRYQVVPYNILGASDIAGKLIGEERLCLAIFDYPAELKKLLSICTDLSIEIAKAQLAAIPKLNGGNCAKFGIWAPGDFIFTQEDLSPLLSPEQFREFILPCKARFVESFDNTVIHLHSIGLHVVDDLLSLDKLAGIQVLVDPSGPNLQELIPCLAKIQERMPLVIEGEFSEKDEALLIDNLSPRGLLVVSRRLSTHGKEGGKPENDR